MLVETRARPSERARRRRQASGRGKEEEAMGAAERRRHGRGDGGKGGGRARAAWWWRRRRRDEVDVHGQPGCASVCFFSRVLLRPGDEEGYLYQPTFSPGWWPEPGLKGAL